MQQLTSDGITGYLCIDGPMEGKLLAAPASDSTIELIESIEVPDFRMATLDPPRSTVSRTRTYYLISHPKHNAVWSVCDEPLRYAPAFSD